MALMLKLKIGLNAQSAPIAELILQDHPNVDWRWHKYKRFVLVLMGRTMDVELARNNLMFG